MENYPLIASIHWVIHWSLMYWGILSTLFKKRAACPIHSGTSWKYPFYLKADKFLLWYLYNWRMKGRREERMNGWTGWKDEMMTGWQDEMMIGWEDEKMRRWKDERMKGWKDG